MNQQTSCQSGTMIEQDKKERLCSEGFGERAGKAKIDLKRFAAFLRRLPFIVVFYSLCRTQSIPLESTSR
jgi:hypothetical protein